MPVTEEYKQTIRNKCTIRKNASGQNVVDWSELLMGFKMEGFEFVLGFDPRIQPDPEKGEGAKWVDPSLQEGDIPAWATKDAYIAHLEALVEKYAPKGER